MYRYIMSFYFETLYKVSYFLSIVLLSTNLFFFYFRDILKGNTRFDLVCAKLSTEVLHKIISNQVKYTNLHTTHTCQCIKGTVFNRFDGVQVERAIHRNKQNRSFNIHI